MQRKQSGNAVVFILLAVALFGALAYTFMRGARSGQGNLSAGQAKLAAQEVMGMGNAMQKAVERVMNHGCSENDITFYAPPDDGSYGFRSASMYDHANNPNLAKPECAIFSPQGGNVKYEQFVVPENYRPAGMPAESGSDWGYVTGVTGYIVVDGAGTSAPDLSFYIIGLRPEICMAINTALGIDNTAGLPSVLTTSSANIDGNNGVVFDAWDFTNTSLSGHTVMAGKTLDWVGPPHCSYLHLLNAR